MTPLVAIAAVAGAVGATAAAVCYRRLRAVRIVRCPKDRSTAAVVLSWRAALPVRGRSGRQHVASCTSRPDGQGCRETCLHEVRHAADGCRAKAIFADWYRRRTCAWCCRPVPRLRAWGRPPGLLAPDGQVRRWSDIPAHEIFSALDSHQAVCGDCLADPLIGARRMTAKP